MLIQRVHVQAHQFGLLFDREDFSRLLLPGRYNFLSLGKRWNCVMSDGRSPWLRHDKLDMILKSGALDSHTTILDLKDHQRALVWVEGRFAGMLGPGLHAAWNGLVNLRTEILEVSEEEFHHPALEAILADKSADEHLTTLHVPIERQGLLTRHGKILAVVGPGRYVFWKAVGATSLASIDVRETVLDITGQDIMTSDKVTLRVNANVTYRVTDPEKALLVVDNAGNAIYRETQLVLRAAVGGRDLDTLLAAKDTLAPEMKEQLEARATELGMRIVSIGIRDIILPGEMKDLMNRVIEAKKAAQANLIARQEETAAMRSQANTAKLLESNPTLMRLRELEVLEKIAGSNKLSVLLGEQGLRERLTTMI